MGVSTSQLVWIPALSMQMSWIFGTIQSKVSRSCWFQPIRAASGPICTRAKPAMNPAAYDSTVLHLETTRYLHGKMFRGGAWQFAEFIRDYEDLGGIVRLAPSGTQSVTMRVIPRDQ